MRKFLIIAFATLVGLSLGAHEADAAKRFGGGQSLGKQRDAIQRQAAPRPPVQAPAATPQAPAQRPGFGGPLAGLLAGGLLGALLFGGAFDGINFADVAILALLLGGGWLLLRSLARGRAPARPAYEAAGGADLGSPPASGFGRTLPELPTQTVNTPARRVPADFDEPAFLEQARKAFVRLQAANDAGDLDAIRDFTTPDFFATLESQIGSRDGAPQKVNVTTLEAELLEVATEADLSVASVLFSGCIRESEEGLPEHFEEIWHVVKDPSDRKSSWLIAGIQQVD